MLFQIANQLGNLPQKLSNTDKILEYAYSAGEKLVIGLLVLIIGMWLSSRMTKLFSKFMEKRDFDPTLRPFLRTFMSFGLKILVIVIVISTMGVEMTSIIAVLGSIGLAIGLALQGSLSNVAGGVMLLLLKPFQKGDLIKAQGETGVVQEISIISTKIKTLDNQMVFIPNGPLASGTITNVTHEPIRRVDITFGISYTDDYNKARNIILKIIEETPQVIKDPLPLVRMNALADSSVNIATRAWCNTEDYWDVFFHLMETVKATFDKEGISIPFPQRDVHIYQA